MEVQTLKIAGRQFVLLAKRDFDRMAEQLRERHEDEYWTQAALEAEAKSRARAEKPIPFTQVERELDQLAARRGSATAGKGRRRGRR